jgi:DNA-binding response OmpR family regulator
MRRLCILIADESADAADALGTLCERFGHEVDFAYEGAFALEAARQLVPDVIFIEVALPRLDGFKIARELRNHAAFKRTLLVAVGPQDALKLTRDAGFDAELCKPAELHAVERLLGRVPS